MRFFTGLLIGIVLSTGVVSLAGQKEKPLYPRIAKAIAALNDARAFIESVPHDFGGHKVDAIKAIDEATKQLNIALAYRDGH